MHTSNVTKAQAKRDVKAASRVYVWAALTADDGVWIQTLKSEILFWIDSMTDLSYSLDQGAIHFSAHGRFLIK